MSDEFTDIFSKALEELNSRDVELTTSNVDEEQSNTITNEIDNEVTESATPDSELSTDTEEVNEVKPDDNTEPDNKEGFVAVNDDDVLKLPDGTEVSVKEALLRQADYTRKTQAVAEERKELDAQLESFSEAINYVENLRNSWTENPVNVISAFVSSTEDATLTFTQVLVDLAQNDKIDQQFLDTFGITKEVRDTWSNTSKQSNELADVKRRLESFETDKVRQEQSYAEQLAVQEAVAGYESQWNSIKHEFDLNLPLDEELQLKIKTLEYASEKGILDLRTAYAAVSFETQAKSAKKSVDKKKPTNAITSKGTTGSVSQTKKVSSIEDAAWEAFNEISSQSK